MSVIDLNMEARNILKAVRAVGYLEGMSATLWRLAGCSAGTSSTSAWTPCRPPSTCWQPWAPRRARSTPPFGAWTRGTGAEGGYRKRDEGVDVITIYRRCGFDRPRHERTRFDSGQLKRTRLERAVERWKAIGMLKLGSVGTDPEPLFSNRTTMERNIDGNRATQGRRRA